MSVYDYSVTTPAGEEISLKNYEGKVLLIVNTATGCGFTPHYKELEAMYEADHEKMKKSDVNGENQLPLFAYLKSQKGFEGFGHGPAALAMGIMLKKIDKNYKSNPDIKWNFTKFVVNRQGEVVARFEPTADMKDVRACVESLL